ncbi:MAG: pyridoxamine 5'-phosphate oxidase family protein [Candidatus Thorarchaeota archaeon]
MMTIDFYELKSEIIDLFNKNKLIVLATSSENHVTARMMSYVNNDLTIYFQTGKNFKKYQQISDNNNVALCFGNIQIEGLAEIKGHPFNNENSFFLELYKESHNLSYQLYSHLEDEVVIEVIPKLITIWKYDNTGKKSYRDFLDLINDTAYRIYN